jgi:hypothetical protein
MALKFRKPASLAQAVVRKINVSSLITYAYILHFRSRLLAARCDIYDRSREFVLVFVRESNQSGIGSDIVCFKSIKFFEAIGHRDY